MTLASPTHPTRNVPSNDAQERHLSFEVLPLKNVPLHFEMNLQLGAKY